MFPLFGKEPEYINFPELNTAVYGLSYHSREITRPLYDDLTAQGIEKIEILLALAVMRDIFLLTCVFWKSRDLIISHWGTSINRRLFERTALYIRELWNPWIRMIPADTDM